VAAFALRWRRIERPTAANPISIMAQLFGSGTAEEIEKSRTVIEADWPGRLLTASDGPTAVTAGPALA